MAQRIGCICLALGLSIFLADTSEAQIFGGRQIIHRPLRFLGHGVGPGYHQGNPGPDVSYYNPWSAKNSQLISQSPEFLARYGHEFNRTPMNLLYSGRPAFSRPGGYGMPTSATGVPAAKPLSADFVPATSSSPASTKAPASTTDSEAEDIEDRFDEEADSLNDAGESDSSGDIDADDPRDADSDEAADSARLMTPQLFLPASHPEFGSIDLE